MTDMTTRLALPLLTAGQAQKEVAHNEALLRLDLLVHGCAVAIGANVPPSDPAEGACWIVGSDPTGAWAGHADALAGWTPGGWRCVAPQQGLAIWLNDQRCVARYRDGAWAVGALSGNSLEIDGQAMLAAPAAAIADPSGGGVIDVEARAALTAVLAALRHHHLVVSA